MREYLRGEYFSHEPVLVMSMASSFPSNIRPDCEYLLLRTSLFLVNRKIRLSQIKVSNVSFTYCVCMVASQQGPAVHFFLCYQISYHYNATYFQSFLLNQWHNNICTNYFDYIFPFTLFIVVLRRLVKAIYKNLPKILKWESLLTLTRMNVCSN